MKNGDKPAYPTTIDSNQQIQNKLGIVVSGERSEIGFTKREIFAMAAMQGILSGRNANIEQREYPTEEVSRWAVQQADDLLKALES